MKENKETWLRLNSVQSSTSETNSHQEGVGTTGIFPIKRQKSN